MRLVCPKCVAQYEVAEQEIPEEGREVQCANCEHIWFQDRIVMFTEKRETADTSEISSENNESEIFEDLEGVGEVAFQRHRDTPDEPVEATDASAVETETAATPEDDVDNILAESYDEEPEYDDDPPMDLPEGGALLGDDVLDVLRKEAEFSSNRGDSETEESPKSELEDEPEDATDHAIEEPLETDLDELTAFLSSQETEDTDTDTAEADPEEPQDITDSEDQVFDPLSDLDAIRSQLDSIRENPEAGEDMDDPVEVAYEPVLPQEETLSENDFSQGIEIPDLDAAQEALLPEEETQDPDASPEEDAVEFDFESFSQGLDLSESDDPVEELDTESSEAIVFDDFEETRPRQAFRADFSEDAPIEEPSAEDAFFVEADKTETTADEPEETDDAPADPIGSALPAAAALGNLRPRSSGSPRRVRQIADPADLLADTSKQPAAEPAGDATAALSRPVRPSRSDTTERPERPKPEAETETTAQADSETHSSRKELLPDVEELDSTLRGEAAAVLADQEQGDTAPVPATKSFGRAFAWTLLILALLVALYVMRPMIIAALPVSGVVLNPYANFIDSMRLMIENLVS